MDTGKLWPEQPAGPFPAIAASHKPARLEWREQQGGIPSLRHKHTVAQQSVELAAAERAAVREGRAVYLGPKTGAVRRDHKKATIRSQHAPNLPHEGARRFGSLQSVNDQHPVEHGIGEGERVLFAQGGQGFSFRPAKGAKVLRKQRNHALRFQTKASQIRNRKAEAQQPLTATLRPGGFEPPIDRSPPLRHDDGSGLTAARRGPN